MSFSKTISVFAALASIFGAGITGWKLAEESKNSPPAQEPNINVFEEKINDLEKQIEETKKPVVEVPQPQVIQTPPPTILPPLPPLPPVPEPKPGEIE
jgi:hypothetical protein